MKFSNLEKKNNFLILINRRKPSEKKENTQVKVGEKITVKEKVEQGNVNKTKILNISNSY